jgi:RHS repeat-associated protein
VMSGTTLQKGFIPLPTGAKAIYTASGLTYYRHHDHLGSSRLATTPSRTLYSSTAYAPFGEPYAGTTTTDLSFTGQDQDTTSGMHDFMDRRYMPVQGRWLTPDPIGLAAVDPSSPQTWNRYAYVANNPLAMIDPFGDDECYWIGTSEWHCVLPTPPCPPAGCASAPPPPGTTGTGGTTGGNPGSPSAGGQTGSTPTPTPPNPCGQGAGIGFTNGGDYQAGNGPPGEGQVMAIVNGQAGSGLFYDTNTGPSVGNLESGAAVGNGGLKPSGSPPQAEPASAIGAFVGGGVSFFVTNGASANQIKGPFQVTSLNAAFGYGISLNWATSGSTWMFSIGLGPMGKGLGASGATYTSNTAVQTTIGACQGTKSGG